MVAIFDLDIDRPRLLVNRLNVSLHISEEPVQPILVHWNLLSQKPFQVLKRELYRWRDLSYLLVPNPFQVAGEDLANILDTTTHHVKPVNTKPPRNNRNLHTQPPASHSPPCAPAALHSAP